MSKIYTCVGSRETPSEILAEMQKLGKALAATGHYIRSGHADGADWAFEQGARDHSLIYLPWKSFNDKYLVLGRTWVMPYEIPSHLVRLAAQFHPNWANLSPGVKKLIARDGCQVLGVKLDRPSKATICWTPGALAGGGTGQAIRISNYYKIPVIDMARSEFSTCEKVLNELKRLELL